MQKLILSVILALFMALAMVGVKRVVSPTSANPGHTVMASGGAPMPVPL